MFDSDTSCLSFSSGTVERRVVAVQLQVYVTAAKEYIFCLMDGVSYLRRSYGFIFVVKKSFVGIVFDCCSAVEKKSFEIQRYPLSLYVVVLTFVLNFALFYIKLLTIFVA